jgi:hypothetical protein
MWCQTSLVTTLQKTVVIKVKNNQGQALLNHSSQENPEF